MVAVVFIYLYTFFTYFVYGGILSIVSVGHSSGYKTETQLVLWIEFLVWFFKLGVLAGLFGIYIYPH